MKILFFLCVDIVPKGLNPVIVSFALTMPTQLLCDVSEPVVYCNKCHFPSNSIPFARAQITFCHAALTLVSTA